MVLSTDVDRPDYVTVALVATAGAVEVPTVAALHVIVRGVHCLTTLTTPRAESACPPRVHRFDRNTDQFGLILN
jgi:hypothetical protein